MSDLNRLEIQTKLLAKFGNTLNSFERNKFERVFLTKLNLPKIIAAHFKDSNGNCILGENIVVHKQMLGPLLIAIVKISKSELKDEIKGKILCYEPRLMADSETTIDYTSWGICFRFDQEEQLSMEALMFFTQEGFTCETDSDGKQYFIVNFDKILK